MPNGILIIAVFSGFAALAYQVTWIRWFGLLFGNSAYAISAVLCAFFAGIAIGSAVFGFISRRVKRPLMLYALIEMTACGFALVVPYVIDLYDPLYESLYSGLMDSKGLFVSVKFALALAAMLPVLSLALWCSRRLSVYARPTVLAFWQAPWPDWPPSSSHLVKKSSLTLLLTPPVLSGCRAACWRSPLPPARASLPSKCC